MSKRTAGATRRLEEWEALIEERRCSGLTVAQWCAAQGIRIGTYNNAVVRVNRQRAEEGRKEERESVNQIVQIKLDEDGYSGLPMEIRQKEANGIAARMNVSGIQIEIMNNAGSKAIYDILSSLQRIC